MSLALAGCLGDFPAAPSGALDEGSAADLAVDMAAPMDLGVDATRPDGGRVDASADFGSSDSGRVDAAPVDAAPVDLGQPDRGVADLGQPDAAPPDMGPCVPTGVEMCNGLDDDCNGEVDDLLALQSPCIVPNRDCRGVPRCDVERGLLICDPTPDADELCNGDDDDCDGEIDESPVDAGGACTVGVGACEAVGVFACTGGQIGCDAVAGLPSLEVCNGLDDDCNAVVDDVPGAGRACQVGQGACARDGLEACHPGQMDLRCDVEPGEPAVEVCNGIDDDCDGEIDDLPGVGEDCEVGQGACYRAGTRRCVGEALRCDVEPGAPTPEVCNDVDDDCDGQVDEGDDCADYAVQHCQVWLGWSGAGLAPQRDVEQWGDCPLLPVDQLGQDRCVASPGAGDYRGLTLGVPMGARLSRQDALAVAFTCGGPRPAVDSWLQASCRVALGHGGGDGAGAAVEALDADACAAAVGPRGTSAAACVSSGGDGRFHPIWLADFVDVDDVFGVAFSCDAGQFPRRSEALNAQVGVNLGLQYRGECAQPPGILPGWPACEDEAFGGVNPRCAKSAEGGAFGSFTVGGGQFDDPNVDCRALLGISLRSRLDNEGP